MTETPDAPTDVVSVSEALAKLRPMRRGTVCERRMKCGQPSCACHKDLKARHGPYFTMNRVVGGKTQSRYLSPVQAELARQQIEAGREFRNGVESVWEACERWADAQLECDSVTGEEGVKKKPRSVTRSTRKSRARSKH